MSDDWKPCACGHFACSHGPYGCHRCACPEFSPPAPEGAARPWLALALLVLAAAIATLALTATVAP